jgi:hypothetical protein
MLSMARCERRSRARLARLQTWRAPDQFISYFCLISLTPISQPYPSNLRSSLCCLLWIENEEEENAKPKAKPLFVVHPLAGFCFVSQTTSP